MQSGHGRLPPLQRVYPTYSFDEQRQDSPLSQNPLLHNERTDSPIPRLAAPHALNPLSVGNYESHWSRVVAALPPAPATAVRPSSSLSNVSSESTKFNRALPSAIALLIIMLCVLMSLAFFSLYVLIFQSWLFDINVKGQGRTEGMRTKGRTDVGSLSLSSTMTASGDVASGSNAVVFGNTSVGGSITAKNLVAQSTIEASGAVSIAGSLSARNASIQGSANVAKLVVLSDMVGSGGIANAGQMSVSGNVYFLGAVNSYGRLDARRMNVSQSMTVGGQVKTQGNVMTNTLASPVAVSVGGSLVSLGPISIPSIGALLVNQRLLMNLSFVSVSTTFTIGGNLQVGGATSVMGTLSVLGSTWISGGLSVGSNASIAGSMSIVRDLSANASLTVGGSLLVSRGLNLSSSLTIWNGLTGGKLTSSMLMLTNASVSSSLSAGGNVSIADMLLCDGPLTVIRSVFVGNFSSKSTALVMGSLYSPTELRTRSLRIVGNVTVVGLLSVKGGSFSGGLQTASTVRVSASGLNATSVVVKGPSAIFNDVLVNGNMSISGQLSLSSPSLFRSEVRFASGGLSVAGNVSIGTSGAVGSLHVAASLSSARRFFVAQTLRTGRNVVINQTLAVLSANVTKGDDLHIGGALNFSSGGTLWIGNSLFVGSDGLFGVVSAKGNAAGRESMTVTGMLTVGSTIFSSFVSVGQHATIHGPMWTGSLTANMALVVNGSVDVEGDVSSVASITTSGFDAPSADMSVNGTLSVGGNVSASAVDFNVRGFTIGGNLSLGGPFSVSGTTFVRIAGDLTLRGNMSCSNCTINASSVSIGGGVSAAFITSGQLTVAAGSLLAPLSPVSARSVNVNGSLSVSGSARLSSVSIGGDTIVAGDVLAQGKVTVAGGIVINGSLYGQSDIVVAASVTVSTGPLLVNGTVAVASNASVSSDLVVSSNFFASSLSASHVFLQDALSVTGNVTVFGLRMGSLQTADSVVAYGNLSIAGSMSVAKRVSVKGQLDSQYLDVSSSVAVRSVAMIGSLQGSSTLSVASNFNTSYLNIFANTLIYGRLLVMGNASFTASSSVVGPLRVGRNIYTTGNLDVGNAILNTSGSLFVQNSVNIETASLRVMRSMQVIDLARSLRLQDSLVHLDVPVVTLDLTTSFDDFMTITPSAVVIQSVTVSKSAKCMSVHSSFCQGDLTLGKDLVLGDTVLRAELPTRLRVSAGIVIDSSASSVLISQNSSLGVAEATLDVDGTLHVINQLYVDGSILIQGRIEGPYVRAIACAFSQRVDADMSFSFNSSLLNIGNTLYMDGMGHVSVNSYNASSEYMLEVSGSNVLATQPCIIDGTLVFLMDGVHVLAYPSSTDGFNIESTPNRDLLFRKKSGKTAIVATTTSATSAIILVNNNNRVCMNCDVPGYTLDVKGDVRVRNNLYIYDTLDMSMSSNDIVFRVMQPSGERFRMSTDVSFESLLVPVTLYSQTGGSFLFGSTYTGSPEISRSFMVVRADGRIGIGTNAPAAGYQLHVLGNMRATQNITVHRGAFYGDGSASAISLTHSFATYSLTLDYESASAPTRYRMYASGASAIQFGSPGVVVFPSTQVSIGSESLPPAANMLFVNGAFRSQDRVKLLAYLRFDENVDPWTYLRSSKFKVSQSGTHVSVESIAPVAGFHIRHYTSSWSSTIDDRNQRVGIGASAVTPQYNLHVQPGATFVDSDIYMYSHATFGGIAAQSFVSAPSAADAVGSFRFLFLTVDWSSGLCGAGISPNSAYSFGGLAGFSGNVVCNGNRLRLSYTQTFSKPPVCSVSMDAGYFAQASLLTDRVELYLRRYDWAAPSWNSIGTVQLHVQCIAVV